MKLNSIKTIWGLALFLFGNIAIGQQDTLQTTKPNTWQIIKYDTKSFVKNMGYSLSAPIRWDKDDFLTAGGVVIGTVLLHTIDDEAQVYFKEQGEHAPKLIRDTGWYFGSPQNFFLISGGVYGVGLLTKNQKVRKTAVLIISSAATSGLIQSISKTVVGRARPGNETGKFDFDPFSKESGYHSFPSGHTTLSISMAHSIAKQFDNIWVKAGIYAVGAIAPISRLWDNAHWVTDIFIGTALSIAVVDCIDNYMKKENRYPEGYSTKKRKISWRIQPGYNKIGLVGTF